MLNPKRLFPNSLGLKWGYSSDECMEVLSETPTDRRSGFLEMPLRIDDTIYEVELYFQVPGDPDVHAIYDAEGNRYDWATGAMWDKDDNLVEGAGDYRVERSGLFRIETVLSTSIFLTRDTAEEIETRSHVKAEYLSRYEKYVEHCAAILGDPVFTGPAYINDPESSKPNWIRNPDYPRGQLGEYLTNWTFMDGLIQVALRFGEYDGFPIKLVMACYSN